MGVETTKGSWTRPVQEKDLAELGKQILAEKDPAKKAQLIAEWHRVNNEKIWDRFNSRTGEWEPREWKK